MAYGGAHFRSLPWGLAPSPTGHAGRHMLVSIGFFAVARLYGAACERL